MGEDRGKRQEKKTLIKSHQNRENTAQSIKDNTAKEEEKLKKCKISQESTTGLYRVS